MTPHPYRIHHRGRKAVYAVVLLLALAAGAGAGVAAGPWAAVAAAIAAYAALFGGWCGYGWRLLRWHGVPDLDGSWTLAGEGVAPVTVRIRQGWTSLLLREEREALPFVSRLAGFVRDAEGMLLVVEGADPAGTASVLRLRPHGDGWRGTWQSADGDCRPIGLTRPAAPA